MEKTRARAEKRFLHIPTVNNAVRDRAFKLNGLSVRHHRLLPKNLHNRLSAEFWAVVLVTLTTCRYASD